MIKGILDLIHGTYTQLVTLKRVLHHTFTPTDTVQYPEEMPYMPPRYRARIILTRDPDGEERCVSCNLCAVACPVEAGSVESPHSIVTAIGHVIVGATKSSTSMI